MPPVWEVLGIPATDDERAIRRAYSARLKVTNPEDKPEDFKILRAAYETAVKMAAEPKAVPAEDFAISPPRPMVPVAPELADYQALCGRLEILVKASADETEMTAALGAIFAATAFQRLDMQARTEIWLLRLIAFNVPRSDPLLPQAIEKFGWSDGAGKREIAQLIRSVFRRERDLQAREIMQRPNGEYHRAFAALTRPFEHPRFLDRLNLRGMYWEVRQCLDFIRRDHPTLMQDLDKQSLAAWQAELAKIRFSAEGWLALFATPPAILLYVVAAPNVQYENAQYLGLLLLPIPVLAGAIFYMLAWQIPRRIWRERWRLAAPYWVAWGWAPALLLLIVAAFVPDSLAGFAFIAGLALLAAAWVIVTAEPDPRLNRPRRGAKMALAFLHAPIVMLCGFAVQVMPSQKFGALFVPGCIATLAFGAGNGLLTRLWLTTSAATKQRLMIGVGAAILAAAALTWNAMSFQALAPLSIAATLWVTFLTIVPGWELPPWVVKLRYRISLPVITASGIAAADGVIVAPYLSVFLLAWAAWTCGFQITRLAAPKSHPLRR